MCRITWYWDFEEKIWYDTVNILEKMRDSMINWWPDDAWIYKDNKTNLLLWHRRLSILDLSSLWHQPMLYNDLVISYNWEIYNFSEVKKELINIWYSFKSNCDTEVILKAYDKWWMESISKFRWMFAIAIWNKSKQKLTLIRDRIWVKPLYYYFDNNIFIFWSEIKSLIKHPKFKKNINKLWLNNFLQFWSIQSPLTIFENCCKLKPWCYLEINKAKQISINKYWSYSTFIQWQKTNLSFDQCKNKLNSILENSIKLRMISDVPLWVFLSWWTDSSLVTSIMQNISPSPIKTFTIGFDEKKYNEAPEAKAISKILGTDHTEQICTWSDALNVIWSISDIYCEPFADTSAIPTIIVSILAKTKVSVSLSADWWDEFFYWYPRYQEFTWPLQTLSTPILKSLINFTPNKLIHLLWKTKLTNKKELRDYFYKLKNIINENDKSIKYSLLCSYFMPNEIQNLTGSINTVSIWELNWVHTYENLQYQDINRYLPDDVLVKVDRSTMNVALEWREPLLDHKILEFSASLPLEYKYQKWQSKYILKKILEKYLPKQHIYKKKKWFSVPIDKWLNNELKDLVHSYLNKDKIKNEWLLNSDIVQKYLDDFYWKKWVNPYKIWLLLIFEMWYEKYMN